MLHNNVVLLYQVVISYDVQNILQWQSIATPLVLIFVCGMYGTGFVLAIDEQRVSLYDYVRVSMNLFEVVNNDV